MRADQADAQHRLRIRDLEHLLALGQLGREETPAHKSASELGAFPPKADASTKAEAHVRELEPHLSARTAKESYRSLVTGRELSLPQTDRATYQCGEQLADQIASLQAFVSGRDNDDTLRTSLRTFGRCIGRAYVERNASRDEEEARRPAHLIDVNGLQ